MIGALTARARRPELALRNDRRRCGRTSAPTGGEHPATEIVSFAARDRSCIGLTVRFKAAESSCFWLSPPLMAPALATVPRAYEVRP
jgi:hypothetical protein